MNISSNVLTMRLLSVDDYAQRHNNQPMKWAAIGKRVKVRRTEKGWTQEELAKKAKVGLGTLQALESAAKEDGPPRQTTPEKLQLIAEALGLSLDDLIAGRDPIRSTDPELVGLNDEDISVARSFHEAVTDVRNYALALFREGKSNIGVRVSLLPAELRMPVDALVAQAEAEIARREEARIKAKAAPARRAKHH